MVRRAVDHGDLMGNGGLDASTTLETPVTSPQCDVVFECMPSIHPAFMAICKDNNSLSVGTSHWIRTKGKNGSIQHAGETIMQPWERGKPKGSELYGPQSKPERGS